MRRASRGSWRIGQRQPVEVHHLVYQATMQAQALALVAAKARAALLVEGELPEEGLAALGGDGQDVLVALARQVAQPAESAAESLEALFAQRRRDEADEEGYLVEGAWGGAITPEPECPADGGPGTGPDAFAPATTSGSDDGPALALAAPPKDLRGQTVSFDDLAWLIERPKRRVRSVAPGQLGLFADRAA